MTKQSKKEIVTPEMINEAIAEEKGKTNANGKPGSQTNLGTNNPKDPKTPKSDTENQDTLNESIDKEEI